ncbi:MULTISPECIES: M23 family metallopeptidase [Bacillus]|uniref:M23 family metallopeptidase n=1 Tax=Bacillus TaxID=1386 RepID=UPI0002D9A06F|nr:MULTISPECIES: peptidoglycan DD-metalloendopeptidase family protein [Bacillus]
MRAFSTFIAIISTILIFVHNDVEAQTNTFSDKKRMELFKNIEDNFQIPWFYMAAIDQYEHSIRNARRDLPDSEGSIGILIPPEKWSGLLNPNIFDQNPRRIAFFDGIGMDGDGNGKANPKSEYDVLVSIASYLAQYGSDEENIRIALWNYYKRDKAVGIVMGNAKLFQKYNRINLHEKAFPVPITADYSYRSTWGVARGWGGRRSHEGTDIFANYGVPVRATCYGIVEIKGWNRYGGWRIGIRDLNNTYHYFAHLSGFAKGIEIGQIVEPGMIIGGVGSTGYGPPGTSGKFPPHLHFGMYKDNGYTEWSFDPYYHLTVWERNERRNK